MAKLKVWNERMLLILAHRMEQGDTQQEVCKRIGITHTNIPPIRKGSRGFTLEHIYEACRAYSINPSWIMGMSSQMKLKVPKSPLIALKDAVRSIEAELLRR